MVLAKEQQAFHRIQSLDPSAAEHGVQLLALLQQPQQRLVVRSLARRLGNAHTEVALLLRRLLLILLRLCSLPLLFGLFP